MNDSGFLAAFMTDLRAAFRHGLWVAAIVAASSAAIDTAAELRQTSDEVDSLIFWLATNPLESGATYIIAIAILAAKPSLTGFAKAMTVLFVLYSPLILLEILSPGIPFDHPNRPFLVGGLVVILVGMMSWIIAVVLLTAWPLAQALSRNLINPERLIVATQGYRAPLILISITLAPVVAVVYLFDPPASTGNAIAYFLTSAASTFLYLPFQAAISVTALRFAMTRDSELAGSVSIQID